MKKQDSYIGIEDAGHMVWLLADCRQEQPTQALAETTDAAQEFDGDNTQAAVVSAQLLAVGQPRPGAGFDEKISGGI